MSMDFGTAGSATPDYVTEKALFAKQEDAA